MKRNFNCSDSLTHFFPPLEEEMNPKEDCIYSRDFQAMLDGDGGNGGDGGGGEDYSLEEIGQIGEKKRRLSNHQVKSLEKIFEIDNKLDPDRKVKVAEDLGLQPRQVAIWFQNRRARWKTKQLERDYTLLKANYDALKINFHKLDQEKQTIIKELLELKTKLHEETIERNGNFHSKEKSLVMEYDTRDSNHETYTSLNHKKARKSKDSKDGFSDSDSSGVLNEESILTSNINDNQLLSMSNFDFSSTVPLNCTQFLDSNACLIRGYQQQESIVKMEDEFLVSSSEESCNIFSIDQAPNLCWYFSDA